WVGFLATMQTAVVVLLALAVIDLLACGLLLALVWVVHHRQRRAAMAAGEPVPPSAAGQFAILGVLGLLGIIGLYGAAWLLLAGNSDRDLSHTRAFPTELWDSRLAEQPGDDIRLPVDIWGFAGGQTFLAGVPCLVFEGPGGFISYLEPAMCRYFAPVIQATKA